MKFSIRRVLIFGIIGLVSVTVASIIISSSISSKQALLHHAKVIMSNIATFTSDKSIHHLIPARDAVELTRGLADSKVVNSESLEGMEKYFIEQLLIYPQFSNVYYGNENGEFIMVSRNQTSEEPGFTTKVISVYDQAKVVNIIKMDQSLKVIETHLDYNDTYDPRTRPWYQAIVKNKKLIWTEPYMFFMSQKPGITTANPVFDETGKLKGAVGVDIEIAELSNFISKLKIGKNGKAFILNFNGDVVAFPDIKKLQYKTTNNKLRLTKIEELDDAVTRSAFHSLNKVMPSLKLTSDIFTTFKHDNKRFHAYFMPFENHFLNWTIGIYIPENDFLGGIKQNQLHNIYIAIAIAVLACIIGYYIASRISSPMQILQKAALKLKNQRMDEPLNLVSSFKEIQQTADTFEKMRKGIKSYEKQTTELNQQLKDANLDTLHRLAIAAEFKDTDTGNHIHRIGAYSEIIATQLGLTEKEIYLIKNASPMHDVGKLGIPDSILLKPGKLTDEERSVMEQHTILGEKILRDPSSDIMDAAKEIALSHHEKWDGSGYPLGLEKNDIPLFGRIVAVVDVFDAIVSKRCYKDSVHFDTALNIIKEDSGTHFDPECVDAFFKQIKDIKKIYLQYQDINYQ